MVPPVDDASVVSVVAPEAYIKSPDVNDVSPVPPRPTAREPAHTGVNVCVSPAEVMVNWRFVSGLPVANVCDEPVWNEEYCAPSAVMPPPAPASAPHENKPLFHMSLSAESAHSESPKPDRNEPERCGRVEVELEAGE